MDKLPTWDEVMVKARQSGQLTVLETFIADWEPVGQEDQEAFRKDLLAVVKERATADGQAYQEIAGCDLCDLCEDHYA